MGREMGREMCFDSKLTIKHGIESREKVELSIVLKDNHLSARRLAFPDSDSIGTTISASAVDISTAVRLARLATDRPLGDRRVQ